MNAPNHFRLTSSMRRLAALLRALRPHQWSKNLLVFAPALAGHRLARETLSHAAIAVLCFCAAASSGYVVNDLLDVSADRMHRVKKHRPIAAGELTPSHASTLSIALAVAAVAAAFALSRPFSLVIIAYLAITVLYSVLLKSKIVVDVIVVAGLLTTRVMGGGVVTEISLSKWLIMFCLFLFLSLSLAKRCSELAGGPNSGMLAIAGRGYRSADLSLLTSMGVAAGYAAALVFAVYIGSEEAKLLYSHVDRLWIAVPFLIYWLSRVLLLANRGDLHEDPIIFAASDRVTWIAGFCVAAIFVLAI